MRKIDKFFRRVRPAQDRHAELHPFYLFDPAHLNSRFSQHLWVDPWHR
jgi:hypothetical protein